ncbi:uncharacterized protein LOC108985566 isoform X2 [Juglans regia]|uniref:Uncharacterized protein LOC108985566 isoform X2 n=1 Tax=Juglans regia TaxID=51240 RepID=A0A2I4E240_JUGRE|nr:uncharacterized protein LOC108985566 isoform X2 [Juglans regia]
MSNNPSDLLKTINDNVGRLKKLLAQESETAQKLIKDMLDNLGKILETHDGRGGHSRVPYSHNQAPEGVPKAVRKLEIRLRELINIINLLAPKQTQLEVALETLNRRL